MSVGDVLVRATKITRMRARYLLGAASLREFRETHFHNFAAKSCRRTGLLIVLVTRFAHSEAATLTGPSRSHVALANHLETRFFFTDELAGVAPALAQFFCRE